MRVVSSPTTAPGQAPARLINGLYIAKAFRSYTKWKRVCDAVGWVRGEVAVTPTIKLAATVFGVSPALVTKARAQLERREQGKHHANGNGGAASLSDEALDRIVAAIGADRMLAAIDRATQPQLPLAAAE
jgi:hypothetical protein